MIKMITIKTTYEQVSQDYPELVQEFLDNLRNSTSKSKDLDIKKIKWFYSWGTFNKKAKSDTDKILRGEDYKKRLEMEYNERWETESEKIKVEITMEAGAFVRGDRCQSKDLPAFITRYAKELLKGQMTAEQEAMKANGESQNQNVIDSIGEINKSIIEEIFPPKLTEMMNQMQSQFGDNKAQRKREITYDVDDLLDKISDSGMDSLTDEERNFLENQ